MTTTVVDTPTALRACVFTLGAETFALPVSAVREVVVFEEWTAVPLAPAAVVGVANLRGEVIPIVDARAVLGLPARARERRLSTLVVAAGAWQVALIVDDVLGLERFEDVVPLAEAARRAYGGRARGLLRAEGRLVTLLDAVRLVGALRGEA